ncbi:hypothetical protein HYV81_03545 [Candidatus Woesearchaeota archaeon]|nr:hypothetical protein [Candidatus Woesearchaeota archaeon]
MRKLALLGYIACALVLVSLMYYSYVNYHSYYPSLATLKENPAAIEGVRAENCGIMERLQEDGFVLRGGPEEVVVQMQDARFPKYGTVCVVGTYREGMIEAESVRYNDYIFVKYALSALSLLFVIYIFLKEWKLNAWRFVPRSR